MIRSLRSAPLVALLLVLAAPSLAAASTMELVGGTLSYRAAPGVKDDVNVYLSDWHSNAGVDEDIVVVDLDGYEAVLGAGMEQCTHSNDYGSGSRVACPAGLVQRVSFDLGDRDDTLSAYGLCYQPEEHDGCSSIKSVPALTANLGAGDDEFWGRKAGESSKPLPRHAPQVVRGGPGNDVIWGGNAADVLHGDAGKDTIRGGGGNDLIRGGAGNDSLYGNYQCLTACTGPADKDRIYGDAGNDTISGGRGVDLLVGGAGNDSFWDGQDGVRDTIQGGAGRDSLVGVDFNRRTYRFKDALSSIESVSDARTPPAYRWRCAGRRCTVTKINYLPPSVVVVVLL